MFEKTFEFVVLYQRNFRFFSIQLWAQTGFGLVFSDLGLTYSRPIYKSECAILCLISVVTQMLSVCFNRKQYYIR